MKITILALMLFSIMALAFSRAFGQEATVWHYSNCPTATNCCEVPKPTGVSAVNLYGFHVSNGNAAATYVQLFNSAAAPAAGATPIGASSWNVPPALDRDVVVGEMRGMAFTQNIWACCSSTQGTFTSVGGCGFLLQYY